MAEKLNLLYEEAKVYVRAHYGEKDLNHLGIAKALGCSTRQLSRAFEGKPETLHAWIIKIRLLVGHNLLASEPKLSIREVARRLHFYDDKHFRRAYKKQFGCLPRQS
ncbi:AraC family transcriptional regulator [Sphingobacterium sp. DN00404]|uniref:AraC family transcriptional regulator n=1 Tax=Sphingobacterium micropteri TaxID=2763501 RepID=A0ABR7YMI7_9SPHI|nr:helix-turn-helix domain-containing protein [Sphingobacterium micropteri]MBD1432532.1 AraC family transcriptional regulator [Sphingobacterium micropteri]